MMIKNITRVLVICLTAAVIGSSASELPPQCNAYLILADATRNVNHGFEYNGDHYNDWCDYRTSPDWQGSNNWYRMMPPAGVVIPETPIGLEHCGTGLPGWIQGSHPANEGEQVTVKVCFRPDCPLSRNIQITNCGGYYVYLLPDVDCGCRYCAA